MFVNAPASLPACLLLLLAVAVFLSQTCLAIYRYRSLYNEDGQLTLLQFLTLLSKHCIRLDNTKRRMETNNNEDPFRVRLKFTAVDYIKMSILAVTLLPIRLIGERECLQTADLT